MGRRRTAEEWQEIFAGQTASGLTDTKVAAQAGISVAGLRYWRQRLKKRAEKPQPLVEVSSVGPVGELRVHLPNGLIVEVPSGWPADILAAVVGRLRAL
jgi:hypothetical protein